MADNQKSIARVTGTVRRVGRCPKDWTRDDGYGLMSRVRCRSLPVNDQYASLSVSPEFTYLSNTGGCGFSDLQSSCGFDMDAVLFWIKGEFCQHRVDSTPINGLTFQCMPSYANL